MHRYAILVFLILVGTLSVLAWAASLPVPGCMVIALPGDYQLDNDITGAPNDALGGKACMVIAVSNVNFDCKGHSITNDGTNGAFGIAMDGDMGAPLSNITVKNCQVKNYGFNVFLKQVTNSVFSNNNILNTGPSPQQGFASVQNSDSNRFENNSVYGGVNGFRLESTSGTTLLDNTVNGTVLGIELFISSGNNFTGNGLDSNENGISLQASPFNVFENNVLSNSNYSVNIQVSENNRFFGNKIYKTSFGIVLSSDSGNNQITSNEISNLTGNISTGLDIRSSNNIINDNKIHDCENICVTLGGSSNNTINNNLIYNGSITFFIAFSNENVFSGNTIHDGSGFEIQGSNQNVFIGNNVYKNGKEAFQFSDSSGNVLENNVYYLNGNGIQFKGSSSNPVSNSVINNTGFSNEAFGVMMDGSTNSLISGNTFYDNLGGGIFLFDGDTKNTIIDNTIYRNGIPGFNFFSMRTGGIVVGAVVHPSTDNLIKNNNVYNNTEGISFYFNSGNNNVVFNKISNNSFYGVYVDSSDNNNFSNNEIFDQRRTIGTYIVNSTGTILENEHFYRNGLDFSINSTIQSMDIKLKKVVFDAFEGRYDNETMLSLNDTLRKGDAYSIRWATNSTRPPEGRFSVKRKYVNMSTTVDLLIDAITWHWSDADTEGAVEDSFELWTYNGSWNVMKDFTVNATTNSLNVTNVNASFYGIMYANATAGDCQFITIALNFTPGCDQNTVALTAAGSPLSLADVIVLREGNIIANGSTDSTGKFFFNRTGASVDIYVNKARTATICYGVPGAGRFTVDLKSPADCGKPGCDDATDCPLGQVCTSGSCVTPPPQCTKNEDCPPPTNCPTGQVCTSVCINSHCSREEKPPCTSDVECTDLQYCNAGNCTAVVTGACGIIQNHTWVPYECCADSDCASGQVCQDNKCAVIAAATYDLTGPGTSFIGDNVTFTVYINSQPMANAQLKVTKPDSSFETLTTDSSGNASFKTTKEGTYIVYLLVNDNVVKTTALSATSKTTGTPLTLDFLAGVGLLLVFLVLLIGVVAFLVNYFFGGRKPEIKKKRTKKKPAKAETEMSESTEEIAE